MPLFTLFCLLLALAALPVGAFFEPAFRRLDYKGRDRLAIAYAGFGLFTALAVTAGFPVLVAPFAFVAGLIMGLPLRELIGDIRDVRTRA